MIAAEYGTLGLLDTKLLAIELKEFPTIVRMYNSTAVFPRKSITSIATLCDILNAMPVAKNSFPAMDSLLKLYLSVPLSSSTAERTFSAMRRLKSWQRANTQASHLNNIMFAYIHKSRMDSLNIAKLAEDFAECNDTRRQYFGKF